MTDEEVMALIRRLNVIDHSRTKELCVSSLHTIYQISGTPAEKAFVALHGDRSFGTSRNILEIKEALAWYGKESLIEALNRHV